MSKKHPHASKGRRLFAASVRDAVSLEIASAAEGQLPEWVPMMPAGQWKASDGRGPFKVSDPAALVAKVNASIKERGVMHKLDPHHQSRTARDKRGHVPAYAWLDQYRVGEGGVIEAHVESWTPRGRAAVASKELRYNSPEFYPGADGEILMITGGGLTNEPAFDRLQVAEAAGVTEAAAMPDYQKLYETLVSVLKLQPMCPVTDVIEAVEALVAPLPEAASAATALGLEAGVANAAIFTAAAERAGKLVEAEAKLTTTTAELTKATEELKKLQTAEHARTVDGLLAKHAKKIPPAKLDAAREAASKDPAAFDALYETVADPLTASEQAAPPAPAKPAEPTLADVPPHLVTVARSMGRDPVEVYKHAQERGI